MHGLIFPYGVNSVRQSLCFTALMGHSKYTQILTAYEIYLHCSSALFCQVLYALEKSLHHW